MALLQGSARFAGYGLLEQYDAGAPRPANRIFNKVYGEYSGISADPAFASGPPGGDPTVLALQTKLQRTQGNVFPP